MSGITDAETTGRGTTASRTMAGRMTGARLWEWRRVDPRRVGWPLALTILMGILSLCRPSLHGQIVPVKTVPVAAGDQFLLFPSGNLSMGGVSLAIPDTLGSVFVNPSTGARLPESLVFGSPTHYSISRGNGSGGTLPLGTLFRSGDWFGGGALAIQELEGARREIAMGWDWRRTTSPQLLSEGSARNLYAFGVIGKRFPKEGISVGVSGFWADLNAMDGVDLLYARSEEIRQSGTLSDLRLGVTKEWNGDRTLELLLLKSRLRMRHDVTYLDWVWTPEDPDVESWGEWVSREEANLDHTDTWGVHLAYQRPLATPGWRVGWSLTGNWKDHPKIPNYEIQNIPRDPGDTRAFGAGVGISRTQGPFRAAMEVFLEPIRSETWADAASDTVSAKGATISAGEKTVENEFDFTNVLVRAGGAWMYRQATFRAGIRIRSISYELEQYDHIQVRRRTQEESWMEWTPGLGASLRLDGAILHYSVLFTTGTGRPGVNWSPDFLSGSALDLSSDFILAPTGPLTLQDARVTTHQLSVVIPIR